MTDSTAVATAGNELVPFGYASREEFKMAIALKKERAEMARAWRATQWGKDMEESTLKALAGWAKHHGIDATEVTVLGGNPYIEASFYLRKLSEMGPDLLDSARADHVEHDPRLDELANAPLPENVDAETLATAKANREWARTESFRRTRERITHGLRDDAPAAVVYRVRLKGIANEFVGADECGLKLKRTIKKRDGGSFTKDADPVGDENPRKTAETRAARRCLRQCVNVFPALSAQMREIEASGKTLAIQISEEHAALPTERRAIPQLCNAGEMGSEDDAIADAETVEAEVEDTPAEPVTEEGIRNAGPRTKAQLWNIQQVMKADVFTDEERTSAETFWGNATYGEAQDLIRNLKFAAVERARPEAA